MSDTEKNTAGKPAADDKSSARRGPIVKPDDNKPDSWILEGTMTFGIAAPFPVEIGDPQCCVRFGARVFLDTDELQAWVEYRHEETCEVWRFLP